MTNVFILESKFKIEDYYSVTSLVGVFSSMEKAEEAISMLEVKHSARLLDEYFDYKFKTQKRELTSLTRMSQGYSTILARKVVGSKAYDYNVRLLEHAQKRLEEVKNFMPEPYEEWIKRKGSFDRNKFIITEITIDDHKLYTKEDIL